MPPEIVTEKLLNWATDIDQGTIQQALKTSRLDIVSGHVALMPDAHVGIGATVGSVIPTSNAIIPAAVGVDIGCGMCAVQTDLKATQLPETLEPLLDTLEQVVPAGVGKGHERNSKEADAWLRANKDRFSSNFSTDLANKAAVQFGSLGSGNHFFEISLDESDTVWIVLHSGSRALGNKLGQKHIQNARHLANQLHQALEDKDLAYFMQDTAEFTAYIADMLGAQDYAMHNRAHMMNQALRAFFIYVGFGREVQKINCHHNFAQLETHDEKALWITRKGAIKAAKGDLGIIPGSMGTRSYIVRGLGNSASYDSCSHGAGRRFSRSKAKQEFSAADLAAQMENITWQHDKAKNLVDEIPTAYKDIDQVMHDQEDLVEIVHTLKQVLNYKGC